MHQQYHNQPFGFHCILFDLRHFGYVYVCVSVCKCVCVVYPKGTGQVDYF